jgi:precorrin-6A/cobalt-precorrin-6A reductase
MKAIRRSSESLVLLLGGTSETARFATRLAKAGYAVLVSTATDIPLKIGRHPRIARRTGRLNEAQMTRLIHKRAIRAIVDVAHPYATELHATARHVATRAGIPCLTWRRPSVLDSREDVIWAGDHAEAARLACKYRKPILLTIGMRNLMPYAREARRSGVKLVARVLPHPDSLAACRSARIMDEHIVTGRGPFSVASNRRVIRKFGIGVLVTKDSGEAGGVDAKLEAARLEKCPVVVLRRPQEKGVPFCENIEGILKNLRACFKIPRGRVTGGQAH